MVTILSFIKPWNRKSFSILTWWFIKPVKIDRSWVFEKYTLVCWIFIHWVGMKTLFNSKCPIFRGWLWMGLRINSYKNNIYTQKLKPNFKSVIYFLMRKNPISYLFIIKPLRKYFFKSFIATFIVNVIRVYLHLFVNVLKNNAQFEM